MLATANRKNSREVLQNANEWTGRVEINKEEILIILIIYPLTARVVGAPQIISQPAFSILFLFSTALLDLENSRPVNSLMLSSHLFLCLPCLFPPFTVFYKVLLARPDERET